MISWIKYHQQENLIMDRKDESRRDYWYSILLDWQKTKLSLAEFARKSCVNYDTIWLWKKRLGIKQGNIIPQHKSGKHNQQQNNNFASVCIVDTKESTVDESTELQVLGTSRLEVLLRCGHGVRFDNTCSLQFVQSVVKLLEVC